MRVSDQVAVLLDVPKSALCRVAPGRERAPDGSALVPEYEPYTCVGGNRFSPSDTTSHRAECNVACEDTCRHSPPLLALDPAEQPLHEAGGVVGSGREREELVGIKVVGAAHTHARRPLVAQGNAPSSDGQLRNTIGCAARHAQNTSTHERRTCAAQKRLPSMGAAISETTWFSHSNAALSGTDSTCKPNSEARRC